MSVQLSINSEQKSFLEIAREKISYYGEQQTGIAEALALIIGKSADSKSCHKISSLSVREILNLTEVEIVNMGFSKSMAERLFASILFAKKLNGMSLPDDTVIRSPEDAANALMYTKFFEQEVFIVVALDTKNKVIGKSEVFKGSLNASIVHPREVYRFAIQKGAASILVCHNHPSGSPSPSREDIDVSKRLAEVGKYVGIELLDSLIIGDNQFVSLKEKGYL
ncbi:RadC family protein [Robertmurraya massiliosenegalensis]|uniref:RadC family protein n=1 Tax=Robertmurraya massiliosenegalensis TaxID=1287657 RepID=UPI000312FFA8|nr:DNA repair protein RadC [Robertmurraya massiliosenegalensis]